ncbi:phosphoenolpyruvate hydrolase family protein [Parahaliea mediterranea]|uniref:phosphoenolpyruvate hydrolase family protein n=1 Tax=Parahaliea mediterranea TaxID=651086 RepID=UPI000E2F88D9|nr:phosphoenolpyruvate hydrolase family protein [Parahaliea mediterranea]
MRIERQEIIRRLRVQTTENRAILGAGCSNGLIAKCAEAGGADLIIVYSTGKTRMMGLPTTMINVVSNEMTLGMIDELRNVVRDTPLIAGIEANDIYCLDQDESIQRFIDKGFSGAINFPTVGLTENIWGGDDMAERKSRAALAKGYGQDSWGWQREVEMIRLLRRKDIFTMTYCVSIDDARSMAEAGADMICAHAGPSRGGLAGWNSESASDMMMAHFQEMHRVVREINPEVFFVIHGGPFYDPESTEVIYRETEAEGFIAASAVERIPIERAVVDTCRAFKRHQVRGG